MFLDKAANIFFSYLSIKKEFTAAIINYHSFDCLLQGLNKKV